jgi:uncharacterized membrane protein (DUF4010 family)
MDTEIRLLGRMGLILVLGFIIGIERGWYFQRKKEGQRTAGVRTFTLIALSGGLWGILSEHIGDLVLGAALLAFVLIIMIGYYQHVQQTGLLGLTTEMAAFITFGIGVAVIKGYLILPVAITVVMVLILSIKPRLHTWIKTIEPQEFYSGILFLIISAVVLPLLPNQGYGPWEVLNPFEIWGMVVLIAGLSYMGYFSMKYLGSEKGILFTSFTGALVSSIAVTVTLGRFAREGETTTDTLVIGALIANFTALARMLLWIGIFNPILIYGVGPSVVAMIVSTSGLALWVWMNSDHSKKPKQFSSIKNPLQLNTAIQFGFILALVMLLAEASRQWLGEPGVYGLSVISGMFDIDSITLSLLQIGGDTLSENAAVNGLILVAIANTFIKGVIFAFFSGIKNAQQLLIFCALIMASGMIGMLFF